MKTNLKQFRQGDVYLESVSEVSHEGYSKVSPENGKLILAYGEVTGHHHSILVDDAAGVELFRNSSGDMILHVKDDPATITHQEHSSVTLPVGDYVAYIQEEYDPEGMRRVQD
jgi:hypothetical protein